MRGKMVVVKIVLNLHVRLLMKIRVPDYFVDFRCTADKCTESCCIGWEIDVDEKTKEKYRALSCEIGKEIAEKTKHGYFPLEKDGRCAFLDRTGLCRIISELGDGYLCDICREHPRYYGVGRHGIEGGLGLGCEEAARIVLSLEELPAEVEIERDVPYSDEDEYAKLSASIREELCKAAFEHDINDLIGLYREYAKVAEDSVFEALTGGRTEAYTKPRSVPLEYGALRYLLTTMLGVLAKAEALDDGWQQLVDGAKTVDVEKIIEHSASARGLFYYFTHRYVREGSTDMTLGARVLFALLSSLSVVAISLFSGKNMVRSAVCYSKNIEYSTDNVDMILDELSEIL